MGYLEEQAASRSQALASESLGEDVIPVAPQEQTRTTGCPTCGASGDDPCHTAAGNVKDTWHSKRGS